MAATTVKKAQFPIGPHRKIILEVTHTGVTSSVLTKNDHGMSNIVSVFANNETTDGTFLVQKNTNASGAALGSIYTTGVISGDVVTYEITGN